MAKGILPKFVVPVWVVVLPSPQEIRRTILVDVVWFGDSTMSISEVLLELIVPIEIDPSIVGLQPEVVDVDAIVNVGSWLNALKDKTQSNSGIIVFKV